MKKLLKCILCISLVCTYLTVLIRPAHAAQIQVTKVESDKLSTDIFVYDQMKNNTINDRLLTIAPVYLIYPNQKVDEVKAAELLEELGIINHIQEYTSIAYIVNPSGDVYDNENDKKAYLEILDYLSTVPNVSANIKVIGIGNGADFANEVISLNSWCISGMLIYGGKNKLTQNQTNSIPTYLHGQNETIINYYVSSNNATLKNEEDGIVTYENSNNSLEKVIVSKKDDNEETLSQAFANAWEKVLCKNYRMYNTYEEWYTSGFTKYTDPYELVSYPMYENMTSESCTALISDDATDNKPNQWYEYLPKNMSYLQDRTVPLVVMLHGNNNDNRMQAETSGWIEKASEEGFACIAPEWQAMGNDVFDKFTALGEEGVIKLVAYIKQKYPQIDESRIYLCGLSAGAINSYNWGVNHVKTFAAIQGSSGIGDNSTVESAKQNKEKGIYLPVYLAGGSHDTYQVLPVIHNDYGGYKVLKAYGHINDIDIPNEPDLDINPFYGLKMDNQGYTKLNQQTVYSGTLSNQDGIMIKAVAMDPYAHWNCKQIIDDVWEFFSNYSRNTETGKLNVLNNNKPNQPEKPIETAKPSKENKPTQSVKTGDNSLCDVYVMIMLLAAGSFILFKRKRV